jgi:hypothetical protein
VLKSETGIHIIKALDDMEKETFSRKIGFLKPGWWLIHCIAISLVYIIGHFLWR